MTDISKPSDTLIVFLKELIFKHVSRRQQKHEKLSSMQRVIMSMINELQHEISNNVVCVISKGSDQHTDQTEPLLVT